MSDRQWPLDDGGDECKKEKGEKENNNIDAIFIEHLPCTRYIRRYFVFSHLILKSVLGGAIIIFSIL